MSASLAEPTYRVSELCEDLRGLVQQAFQSVWVSGEIQRLKDSQRGHLYFELIEKDAADGIVAKLDAVIWRTQSLRIRRQLADTGQRLAEGLEIRCRCRMDFWPPGGRLQLVVEEVDPVFTLGLLEQRRRQTLAALEKAGLLDRNRTLALPELPLRLGLVTSAGSAAYHDFVTGLEESGYGFQVFFVHAAVQGKGAEGEIASALEILGGLAHRLDGIALIRGGGSRSDLAVFDSRRVAEAVARCPLPVLTGLGHEIDQSISDRVAHTPLKTPTKVAEFLVERLASAEAELEELRRRLVREAREPLRRGGRRVAQAERDLRVAGQRLRIVTARLEQVSRLMARFAGKQLRRTRERQERLGQQLGFAAQRLVATRRERPRELLQLILATARGRLAEVQARLEGLSRLCVELSPRRTLHRGFSLTRDADGRVLRGPDQVTAGAILMTELDRGVLKSRVEE
ncbi:MAG: exodeoxyribonuclease VII large subunit [Acidobacteria bacterium]|nr:exodeoxyribonuclease VII large subunit [Acidobacteriota bacterium]